LLRRTLITALAMALLAASPARAALPQQAASGDLASPGANPLVHGSGSGEQTGTSVAALGDVNGDGVDDVALGAPLADANGRVDSGSVYVVYGRDGLAARTDLARMAAGGVRIDGAVSGDRLGDTAYIDKRDKVRGCEKRVYSKPKTTAKKRRKSKK
jgi:FG-GAP repeat